MKKILSIIGKIIIGAVAVLLVIFTVLEIFIHTYNPVETQMAVTFTQEQLLTVDGMVIRDEQYVTYSSDRVLDYAVSDGQKVSSGDVIAYAYATLEDAENGRRSNELRAQIDHIKSISSVNDYYVLDLDRIKDQITQAVIGISSASGSTGVSSVHSSVAAFTDNVTKKQAATGIKLDFSSRIVALQDEIEKLDASVMEKPKKVTTSSSGYFFSECDGYENSVDISSLKSMTADDFRAIERGEVPENAIGKTASSYVWYYVFATDRQTAQEFSEGTKIEMRFPVANAESFPAKVEKINYTADEALVVLSCDYMSEEFAVPRDQTVQIIVRRYTGLFVDYDAIRINDGIKGVYVLIGVEVKFRTIEVLYSCEDYVIAKQEEPGSGGLQLYDYVITKGNDIYDGKLIYRQT